MAKHLQRGAGGHLLRRGVSVDHLANECGGNCNDLTCPNSDVATVTSAGPNGDCTCVSDNYTLSKSIGLSWVGGGGWCDNPETDFALELICQAGGTWLIKITSYVGGYVYFQGTATTAEISCTGAAFVGSKTIAGVDNSPSGPDCSGCTATVSF